MKFSIKEIQPQVNNIHITIEKDDYQEKLDSEFKNIRKTAQLKGFRKGKTPLSVVKKFYGESTMAKMVMGQLEEQLGTVLKDEEMDIILQPQLSKESPSHEFDPSNYIDYEFVFEAPVFKSFEVKGIDGKESLISYDIEVDKEAIDKEIESMTKRQGTQEEAEKDINEQDIVTVFAKELNGKKKVKKDGWETGFDILIGEIEDEYKKELLGKDVGFEFQFDIFKIEKDKSDKYVNKYLLNLDPEEEKEIGNMFQGEIKKISRLKPAEVNEEFLKKAFPAGDVTTEKDAREKVKEIYKNHYNAEAKSLLRRNLMEHLIDQNQFELPDAYMKEYLLANNEGLTEDVLEKEYSDFANNLRWSAIKNKLSKDHDVNVGFEEIQQEFEKRFVQMLGGAVPEGMDLSPYVQNAMQNQDEVMKVYNELASSKLLDSVAEKMTLQEEKISIEKFGELVKELNEKLNN